jgi:uncharacterized membrane protein YadS
MTTNSRPVLHEDWATVLLAFLSIALAVAGIKPSLIAISWNDTNALRDNFSGGNLTSLGSLWLFGFGITVAGMLFRGDRIALKSIIGYTFIFVITLFAHIITGNTVIKDLGLEVVLFSLLTGLLISNVTGAPEWVKPLIQTEFYIKVGLVLLGCGIIFKDVLQAGALGLLQSLAVVFVVWQFSFWLCKKFGLDDELRTMLSSAVAICGVSAAIATAGAIKGDSKKLSYVISLVLITAIPMMLLMPYIARAIGLSDAAAGAWLGGTIDTTGAVVAAGTVLGDDALKYATVVKFSQNVLLGLAAFAISVYWTYTKNTQQEKPTARVIWERFPKFVLGFILASLLFSFVIPAEVIANVKGALKGQQTFWFALAFTCIGLETKFVDIFKMDSGRPALAFLIAQLFNILFTLLMAWLIF